MPSVTLDALVAGLRRRGTPLASESALFVALECADAITAAPRSLSTARVSIDSEGRVDAIACDESSETAAVRSIGALVRALCEPVPATVREFIRRTEDGSIAKVASAANELEALLVPLNRGAARRVVSRLAREVAKDPPPEAISAPAPPTHAAASSEPSALGSSVDTEPEGNATGDAATSAGATATVVDMTPLPSKLPPPPRLGSLTSLPIGPSRDGDAELHAGEVAEDETGGADHTVPDGDALETARSDAEESLDTPRKTGATESRKPLIFVGVFFVCAVLFFLWRVAHR